MTRITQRALTSACLAVGLSAILACGSNSSTSPSPTPAAAPAPAPAPAPVAPAPVPPAAAPTAPAAPAPSAPAPVVNTSKLISIDTGSSAGGLVLHTGDSATGNVTLDGPAPSGGASIDLLVTGAERAALTVPANVTVPAGARSTTYTMKVSTSGVAISADVTINATYAGVTKSVNVRLAK